MGTLFINAHTTLLTCNIYMVSLNILEYIKMSSLNEIDRIEIRIMVVKWQNVSFTNTLNIKQVCSINSFDSNQIVPVVKKCDASLPS